MKKHFILLSALMSLQASAFSPAFSPSGQLYKIIQDVITLFTKAHASMAAQNSNSAPQGPRATALKKAR